MGRGRAKAKQTRVARELKYSSHDIDLDRLREELAAAKPATPQQDAPQDQQSDT